MSAHELLDVHVVSHTHWDREWYRTAGEFRQLLVPLIDELLDDPGTSSFLLDGQTILLEDYLAIRPERAAELRAAFREGRLEAGPWYVLADELIPCAESFVRNLLAGRRTLRPVGAMPPQVMYSPDAFGHAAGLPTLALGFGAALAVVWRGYGGARWPTGDVARWRGPDGAEVLLLHLPPDGYEFGATLPTDEAAARARWGVIERVLGPRATTGIALLPNGADHHARQVELQSAVKVLAQAALPHRVHQSTLAALADTLRSRVASRSLSRVSGELRDSYGYTWTLGGTLATRAAQKRRHAMAERLLLRDVEPWLALLSHQHGSAVVSLLDAAWRELLACQPHDSLCGCSTDDVAEAVDARLTSVMSQGTALRDSATRLLLGHDADGAAARREQWSPVIVLRNRAARPRGGVAEIEIDRHVVDVPVGPGSARPVPEGHDANEVQFAGVAKPQRLSADDHFVREEAPRHYPKNALVTRERALVWIDASPPLGLVTLTQGKSTRLTVPPGARARATRSGISNGWLAVEVVDGSVRVRAGDRVVESVIGFEARGEQGDLYTPSEIPGTSGRATLARWRTTARGPLRAELTTWWKVPVGARSLRSATGTPLEHRATMQQVQVQLQLDAAGPFLRLRISGDWEAPDARLRCIVRTGVGEGDTWADAMFGDVRRSATEPPLADQQNERYVATAPLHRFVSRYNAWDGATVFSDGLAEYESTADGAVTVTLVRSVGELSRADLAERPGHAGWPSPTPRAQCLGPFEATLALALHGPRTPANVAFVHALAEDILLPLTGSTWRSAIEPPASVEGFELSGNSLTLLAVKPSEDRGWTVLRCLNLSDDWTAGRWRHSSISEAKLARLDETPIGALPVVDGVVDLHVPPRAVVTILVR